MDFCCCLRLKEQDFSDATTDKYFSQNNAFLQYRTSEDMKDQQVDTIYLSLYGKVNYSLARNTEEYIQFNSSPKNIPLELLNIIAEKFNHIVGKLQVFIPYSNDEQLLQYFLKQKNFQIYTLEDDQNYLNKLENQKILSQLKLVQRQEFIDNFDLKIFNCCSQTQRMFQLLEKSQINSIPTNQVFIFEYCPYPHKIISQIMQGQETQKEELMTVSIGTTKKYYLFFTGKMSSTKDCSRLKSIEYILLENAESHLNCPNRIKDLLRCLKEKQFTYQQILQIIGSIKHEHADELKKQQSDSILQMFLQKLIAKKIVDKSKIQEIFQCAFNISTITQNTRSQQDIIQNLVDSYDKVRLRSNSRVNIQM